MPISPVTSVRSIMSTQQSDTASKSETASKSDTASKSAAASPAFLDRDAFLKLLVAQLKYQDPSKPMDASAMIAQSAQLSVVDKLSEISTALARTAVTDRLTLAGSVIGKQITFSGKDGYPVTETVTSVRFEDGGLLLSTGSWEVPLESVAAISGAPTATEPATTP